MFYLGYYGTIVKQIVPICNILFHVKEGNGRGAPPSINRGYPVGTWVVTPDGRKKPRR